MPAWVRQLLMARVIVLAQIGSDGLQGRHGRDTKVHGELSA